VSLVGEILQHFEHRVENIRLVPSDGGRFEVTVNDQLVYSKLMTNRHAEPGEVIGLIKQIAEG
jgi:selenoprotein W-related protein